MHEAQDKTKDDVESIINAPRRLRILSLWIHNLFNEFQCLVILQAPLVVGRT